jgi:hypothetical protein
MAGGKADLMCIVGIVGAHIRIPYVALTATVMTHAGMHRP